MNDDTGNQWDWLESSEFDASMDRYAKQPYVDTVPVSASLVRKAEAIIRFSADREGVVHSGLARIVADELKAVLASKPEPLSALEYARQNPTR
jgi:hypothetical protein